MGTLCCWAAVGAVVGPEAGPELSRGGKESCSAVLQGERYSAQSKTSKIYQKGSGEINLIPAFCSILMKN